MIADPINNFVYFISISFADICDIFLVHIISYHLRMNLLQSLNKTTPYELLCRVFRK